MFIERLNRAFFLSIFFVAILFNSCSEGGILYANHNNSSVWGMNAHLTFSCSEKHMDELCQSMSEAGVSIVRLDLYWSPENMLAQRKEFDKAAYYVTKYGMEILLNIPQAPILLNEKELEKWCDGISYYVKRYDGSTPIDIGNGEVCRKIDIRYFEIMNEPEQWERSGLTVESLFNFIKKSSEAIWKVRKKEDISIVMPGICNQENFNKQLLAYTDKDGKGLNDYIDIWNFHYYSDNDRLIWQELQKWKSFFKTKEIFKEKQLWMTEYGHSLWDQLGDRQSQLLVKQGLVAASLGIDRIFYYQYHQFGGNYFANSQKEDFFGIIDTSIKNSYGSFWKNDGIYKKALSDGDATRKIYITPKRGSQFSLYTLTKSICKTLKKDGVAIGGRGFTIDSVILKKRNGDDIILYTGKFVISQKKKNRILRLNAGLFKNVEETDKLIVKVKDITNQDDQWDGVHPLKSYYAYNTLTKLCPSGSRVHRIDNNIGVSIVTWETNSVYRYALWSDSKQTHIISVKNGKINSIIGQQGGKLVNKRNTIRINDDVIYLESNNELEFIKAL